MQYKKNGHTKNESYLRHFIHVVLRYENAYIHGKSIVKQTKIDMRKLTYIIMYRYCTITVIEFEYFNTNNNSGACMYL